MSRPKRIWIFGTYRRWIHWSIFLCRICLVLQIPKHGRNQRFSFCLFFRCDLCRWWRVCPQMVIILMNVQDLMRVWADWSYLKCLCIAYFIYLCVHKVLAAISIDMEICVFAVSSTCEHIHENYRLHRGLLWKPFSKISISSSNLVNRVGLVE